MGKILSLTTPKDFNFKRTVLSHGWSDLPPFELDRDDWVLKTVIFEERPYSTEIYDDQGLKVKVLANKISKATEANILSRIGHILRFDDNLAEFYKMARSEKEFAWIAKQRAGRMLRSTSVYEDLVKTICTTNCTWSLTTKMIANLVEKLGEPAEDGKRAFPTAEKMAVMPESFFQEEIKSGYRGPYLKELAELVAVGRLDPEAWLHSELPTDKLKKEMIKVKGVGAYAAENLLKLIGRYDGLALDSWLRSNYYEKYCDGVACSDKHINSHYERFGKWRGLIIWLEMTRTWVESA